MCFDFSTICDRNIAYSKNNSAYIRVGHYPTTVLRLRFLSKLNFHNLMFSDRASRIDYTLITNLITDYYLFIKYYTLLHVSNLKCSSSGEYSCIHAAYGTVTL